MLKLAGTQGTEQGSKQCPYASDRNNYYQRWSSRGHGLGLEAPQGQLVKSFALSLDVKSWPSSWPGRLWHWLRVCLLLLPIPTPRQVLGLGSGRQVLCFGLGRQVLGLGLGLKGCGIDSMSVYYCCWYQHYVKSLALSLDVKSLPLVLAWKVVVLAPWLVYYCYTITTITFSFSVSFCLTSQFFWNYSWLCHISQKKIFSNCWTGTCYCLHSLPVIQAAAS